MDPRIDETTCEAQLEKARQETRDAFANRALMYFHIFEELSAEIGPERAEAVMKRAIHKRGLEVGRKYRPAAAQGDLDAVGRLFCEGSPCAGALFGPGIEERGEDVIVLRMTACPLKEAWEDLGLSPQQVDLMCQIASAVDEGTFEMAGLELTFRDRLASPGSKRCLLELRLPSGLTDAEK
ncbi:MAG: L-2-amino-thiazoline-4-carboxylic acid hydrolase [Coriobacteriales bacterium]|nr:L-2-amino-thiazoline-4-carboxylic acid hydrolase [Coriobacteriales bacterium]